MHLNSELLFKKYVLAYFKPGRKILEIGPDKFPSSYETWAAGNFIEWHTLDLNDRPLLSHRAASEYSFPIADCVYDIVLSGQVMEHVRKPWVWIRELARVSKAGGLVITIAPASWPYHVAPGVPDCWRIFPEGMHALYEEAGLTMVFSCFESLELPQFRRSIPGRSWPDQGRMWKLNRILGKFGVPIERSFDTIAIGRKDS